MSIDIDFIENEWIPALRSGEYAQTDSYLHRGDKFCCLGVACDLLIKRGELSPWTTEFSRERSWMPEDVNAIESDYQWLPDHVANRLGLCIDGKRHDGGLFTGDALSKPYSNLTEANDDNIPFTKIADLIENYIEDVKRDSAP